MTRSKQINIRVNADEYAQLLAEAEKAGVSVSTFVRESSLRKKLKARPSLIDSEAWIELARVGNNLNQIAKHLNVAKRSGGDDAVLDAVAVELDDLRRLINVMRSKLMGALK
jgi:wyosine [tRNA(Phe)-imidazoG37] synthetase (radical SAM superfamily)